MPVLLECLQSESDVVSQYIILMTLCNTIHSLVYTRVLSCNCICIAIRIAYRCHPWATREALEKFIQINTGSAAVALATSTISSTAAGGSCRVTKAKVRSKASSRASTSGSRQFLLNSKSFLQPVETKD